MVNSDSEKCTFNADGAPNEDCRFLDDQTGTYLASLMYKQFLPQVQKFCDSPDYTFGDPAITHNAEAPNRQNIECASMSIWEVLRQHSDFRNVSDTFVGGFRPVNFQPTFRILKRRSSTAPLILVLDTSASMNDFQRLHTLRQASYNLITRVLNDDQIFAVVIFNSEATLVIEADTVGVERDALPNRLPVQGLGHTSIASGVMLAIQELKSSLPNYAGSNMIVLTDGEETVEPRLTGLNFSELAGITVHTIAFGQRADSILEDLAIRTGGRTFQHRDESTNLFSIFTRLAVQDDSGTVEILSENFNLTNSTRRFFMDPNSGDQISILITFPQYHLSKSDVQVMKPNGDVINSTATLPDVYRSVLAFDLIEIDSEVMVGEWQIRVSYFDTIPPMFMGTMHVVTKRLHGIQKLPIQIDATWALSSVGKIEIQTLYVAVSQGYTPIINADVRVTVMVPNGPHVPLEVWDDGVGPDVRSGDGVYSGFFTQFKGIGRYSVKVTVLGVSKVTKVLLGVFVGQ
ncbi:calcium-activated chloride channel regulator 1-like [Apostichopus japonicus]|uniref:calcium-activated chloride channel regulator 1-like n=1 Tax=Stichopus japonicus TaxID=307972 RepID=UPI003AB6AB59